MRTRAVALLLGAALGAACATPAGRPAAAPARRAPAAAPTAAGDASARGPLLWRIETPAGASYLFGTIHAGFQADRELAPVVWDRLAEADAFVMEADLNAVSPIEVMKRAALPKGQALDALLGSDDWARLRGVVGPNLPEASLKVLAPWFVYSLVLQTLYPTPMPLDLALQQRARRLGKEIAYLEDWRFQLDVLAQTMSLDDLRELLGGGTARTQLDALIAAYREGAFDRLSELTLDPEERRRHPERAARLFDDRNRAWIELLLPMLQRGTVFVAVGVGHFAGDAGLIALLRARGFAIQRVAP
jgi:hypothetical protein